MFESILDKLNLNPKKFSINQLNWRGFLISALGIFIMVSVQILGTKLFGSIDLFQVDLLHAKPSIEKINIFNDIKPKLEQKKNDFKLNNTPSIIHSSFASSAFDNSKSYIVIDYDKGDVLFEKNSDKRLPIASLTKLMTAVVALDLASPKDSFTVSLNAQNMIPTKIGVVKNQKMNLEELLNALMLTSANDAAQVIKEGIDEKYGKPIFIKAMNEKAEFLGLKNSNFSNPQGFDSAQNYSSAQDLAVLTHYALTNYPLISEIVKKDYQYLPENKNHKQFDLYNWNGLLGVYPNVLGVKIGNTTKARITTIVLSQRQDKKVLVVLLGAPSALERDLWAAQLLDLGFEETLNLPKIAVNEKQLKEKYSTWKYWN